MATYSSHRLIMGKVEIDNFCQVIGDIYIFSLQKYLLSSPPCFIRLLSKSLNYTPGIYADGYIVFAFPFVHSSVRMFVCSLVRSFVRSWNLRQSFALKFLKWCISQQLLIRKHSYLDHSYPGGLAFTP